MTMRQLIPTKSQWKSWSLPSKLTAIGTLIGFFSIMLTVGVYASDAFKINAEPTHDSTVIDEAAGKATFPQDCSGSSTGGLVGHMEGGTIENSYVISSDIEGCEGVGGLVGSMNGGEIKNSGVRDSRISGKQAGAAVGKMSSGTISDVNTENNRINGQ